MLKFDRNARIEFLTGFKKRKDERRVKAKEVMKQEKRKERQELRETKKQQRENIEQQYE